MSNLTLTKQTNSNDVALSSQTELATVRAASMEKYEIEAAITIAKSIPRNELDAAQRLIHSCQRPSMADAATYSFPRGGTTIEGPSVKIAREAARVWGNIRYGLDVVREDDNSRLLRGWAWDLESNTKVTSDDLVEKVIERKSPRQGDNIIGEKTNKKGEVLKLVIPDEREMRELQNRRGAFLIRNCILSLIPPDVIDDALLQADRTLVDAAQMNIADSQQKIVIAFGQFHVTQEMLEKKIGRTITQFTPQDIKLLRRIYSSVKDGNSTIDEEFARTPERAPSLATIAKPGGVTENRGHGGDNLQAVKPEHDVNAEQAQKKEEDSPRPKKKPVVKPVPPSQISLDRDALILRARTLHVTREAMQDALGVVVEDWTEDHIETLTDKLDAIESGIRRVEDEF